MTMTAAAMTIRMPRLRVSRFIVSLIPPTISSKAAIIPMVDASDEKSDISSPGFTKV